MGLGGSTKVNISKIIVCTAIIGRVYSAAVTLVMVLRRIFMDPTRVYILQTFTKSGDNATTKKKWKLHIRSRQVALVFSPNRVKLDELKKIHPAIKAHVNRQSE